MPTNHITTLAINSPDIRSMGVIDIHRTNRPAGLRKPYEYIDVGGKKLKRFETKIKKRLAASSPTYKLLKIKSVKYGFKLQIFVCGTANEISEAAWSDLTESIQKELTLLLGEDAKLYVEPFSANRRFQSRFETYIYTQK